MSSHDNDERPVEVFCPVCGYTSPINDPDKTLESLPRDEKLRRIRLMQEGENPPFTCSGCDDPEGSVRVLEIR